MVGVEPLNAIVVEVARIRVWAPLVLGNRCEAVEKNVELVNN